MAVRIGRQQMGMPGSECDSWNDRDRRTHCNINNFSIPAGRTVYVKAYDGTNYGKVEIIATSGNIAATGVLNAVGKGYAADQGPDRKFRRECLWIYC